MTVGAVLYSPALGSDTDAMTERIVPLISAEAIQTRVDALGAQITADYAGRASETGGLVVVSVLKGSFLFCADLVRKIDVPLRIDFLAVRSYGEATKSSGIVQIVHDLSRPIEGEDVLLVEDIVDTGLTLAHVIELLKTRRPRSIKLCSLLHKPARTKVEVPIDYLGFTIEDKFVIGYGLDGPREHYRNLPYVGVLADE